jgi:hypothetical protein
LAGPDFHLLLNVSGTFKEESTCVLCGDVSSEIDAQLGRGNIIPRKSTPTGPHPTSNYLYRLQFPSSTAQGLKPKEIPYNSNLARKCSLDNWKFKDKIQLTFTWARAKAAFVVSVESHHTHG